MYVCMYVFMHVCMYAYMHAFTPHFSLLSQSIACFAIIYFHTLMDDELCVCNYPSNDVLVFVRIWCTRFALHTCVNVTLLSNCRFFHYQSVVHEKCKSSWRCDDACNVGLWIRALVDQQYLSNKSICMLVFVNDIIRTSQQLWQQALAR